MLAALRQVMRRQEQQAVLDAFNRRLGRPGGTGALPRAPPVTVGPAAAAPAALAGAGPPAQSAAPAMLPARGAGATQELMARFRCAARGSRLTARRLVVTGCSCDLKCALRWLSQQHTLSACTNRKLAQAGHRVQGDKRFRGGAQVWRQPGRAVQRGGRGREGARDDGRLAGAAQEPGQPRLLAHRAGSYVVPDAGLRCKCV